MSKNENIRLNFSIIDIGESLPIPQYKESGFYDWIQWGSDNDFPNYLIDVYKLKSITHKAIIDRMGEMMSTGFEDSTDPEVNYLINNPFSKENLNEILYKVSIDLLIMGGFGLEVIWSNDGKRVAQIEHIPFETIRIDKFNGTNREQPDYYWLSKNWKNRIKYTPTKIQAFSTRFKDEKRQLLYVSEYDAGKTNMSYPLVNWYSSVNSILAEWHISESQLRNIKNGFSAGFLINFPNGDVSDEEKAEAYRLIKERFTGSYNTGEIIINYSNGPEGKAEIVAIPNQTNDTKYIELNNLLKANIMTANGVTNAELFAYDTSGGVKFTSKDQLREMLEVFQLMCIDPKIKLIEGAFNKLLTVNSPTSEIKIKKYTI